MNASVSAILRDCYGISAKPGAKVKCPFCHHKTFSLKRDDLLGKCFHPACGRFITPNQGDGQSSQSLANVLAVIYHDFHQALLSLKEAPYRNAYNYLVTERQIHPRVVADSMLGAVPSGGYGVDGKFRPLIQELEAEIQESQQMNGASYIRSGFSRCSLRASCGPNRSWHSLAPRGRASPSQTARWVCSYSVRQLTSHL